MQTVIRVLKDGRVRIHFFARDDAGPVTTPSAVVPTSMGLISLGGAKGFIACEPRRQSVSPELGPGNRVTPCCHTDEPRAVTCPECLETETYKKAMAQIADILNVQPTG